MSLICSREGTIFYQADQFEYLRLLKTFRDILRLLELFGPFWWFLELFVGFGGF